MAVREVRVFELVLIQASSIQGVRAKKPARAGPPRSPVSALTTFAYPVTVNAASARRSHPASSIEGGYV